MIYNPSSSAVVGMFTVLKSMWSTVCNWSLEVIIGLILSGVAAAGAVKILWRKRAKPKLLAPELFIKTSGSYTNTVLFRCIVRNSGSKLCSVERVKIEFDEDISLIKGGAVNISSNDENEQNIASTELPVDIPPDGSKRIILVGHVSGSEKCPEKANIEIGFSEKTKPVTESVVTSKKDIIKHYGRIQR